ncbi:MAG: EpsG family protein [Muribaculum sp.]|nr:EpsG family protein [Muribaculum sp.]
MLYKNKPKYRFLYLGICFLSLSAIAGLRGYSVGGDLEYYLPLFKDLSYNNGTKELLTYDKYGFLFKFIYYCASFISCHYTYYLIFGSAITIYFILKFIGENSRIICLSIFLYIMFGYYTNSFNSIRSSIALSISTVGINYLIKDKKFYAFIIFLICIELHKTILPILILLFVGNVRITVTRTIIIIAGSVIISSYLTIGSLSSIILMYNLGYANATEFGGQGYTLLIFDIIVVLICCFNLIHTESKADNIMMWALILGTCLQTLAPIFSFVTRISYFFTFYMIILIPNLISECNNNKYKIIYASSIIGALCYFQLTVMSINPITGSNAQHTLPYYYVWENEKDSF